MSNSGPGVFYLGDSGVTLGWVMCGVVCTRAPGDMSKTPPLWLEKEIFFFMILESIILEGEEKNGCFVLDSWVFTCFFRHKFGMLVFTTRGAIWSPMGPDSLGDENDHHGY